MIRLSLRSGLLLATYTRGPEVPEDYVLFDSEPWNPPPGPVTRIQVSGRDVCPLLTGCLASVAPCVSWQPALEHDDLCVTCGHGKACHAVG